MSSNLQKECLKRKAGDQGGDEEQSIDSRGPAAKKKAHERPSDRVTDQWGTPTRRRISYLFVGLAPDEKTSRQVRLK